MQPGAPAAPGAAGITAASAAAAVTATITAPSQPQQWQQQRSNSSAADSIDSQQQRPSGLPSQPQQQQQQQQQHRQRPPPPPSLAGGDRARAAKFVLAGGLAGAVSRTATAPVDRLKMLLQVQESQHLTLRQGLKMMAAEGSARAYFKGNGTNVLKIAPETSIKLALNDWLKHHAGRDDPRDLAAWQRVLIGGVSGAVGQGLVYPLDTVRTRLAVCHSSEYAGIFATAARLLRAEGIGAFYRGLAPSMVGILPYAGTDIALFEILNERLHARYSGGNGSGDGSGGSGSGSGNGGSNNGGPPHLAIVGAGMASSVVAQFVSYPLALVRTRLQAQGVGGNPIKYAGMADVFAQTLRNEGFAGLYKGLLPNLIKLAPAAGISWYVFEETKVLLGIEHGS